MHIRSIVRAGVAALLVVAVAACGPDGPDAAGSSGAGSGAGAGDGAGASSGASSAATDIAPGDSVEFTAVEFAFAPNDLMATSAKEVLDELVKWAQALKPLRG